MHNEHDINVVFHPGGADIRVGNQHLSRLTRPEVREVILRCIAFGGKRLREEVRIWLNDAVAESVCEVISRDSEPTTPAGGSHA